MKLEWESGSNQTVAECGMRKDVGEEGVNEENRDSVADDKEPVEIE